MLGDVHEPLSMLPERTGKADYEYSRRGICSIFIFTEPLTGWRYAKALPRRTKVDWANQFKWVLDTQYPNAEKVVVVMDNLNMYTISSFYEAFEPEEALRLAQRLEIHHTPKHGSWLNIAKIELSVMAAQCLGKRRIPNINLLNTELSVWQVNRNFKHKGVDW